MKKKVKTPRFPGFNKVPNTAGIILDSIWIKNDNTEIKIISAFGGRWEFRPLKEEEKSL